MRGRLWILLVGTLLAVTYAAGIAQEEDARTLVQTSLRAMGAENVKSITYSRYCSGLGKVSSFLEGRVNGSAPPRARSAFRARRGAARSSSDARATPVPSRSFRR